MQIARDRLDNSVWIVRKELLSRYYSAYQLGSDRKIRFRKPFIERYLEEPIAVGGLTYLVGCYVILARSWRLLIARGS